jgi:hypothetical protein
LRRQIAERLTGVRPTQRRQRWLLPLAAGLAAACLAVLLLWKAGQPRETPPTVGPPPEPPVAVEDALPTLLAYERALARSPEDLDALLNKHPQFAPERVRIGAFTRSDAALRDLLGED